MPRRSSKKMRKNRRARNNDASVQFASEARGPRGRKRKARGVTPSEGKYVGDAVIGRAPGGNGIAKSGVILSGAAVPAHRKTTTSGSKSYTRTVKIGKGLLPS